MNDCTCTRTHRSRRIVVTGGPGAGKTAVLELIRRAMCHHVHVLPESAGIVFGGGFPREARPAVLRPAQRAIYYVQRPIRSWMRATSLASNHVAPAGARHRSRRGPDIASAAWHDRRERSRYATSTLRCGRSPPARDRRVDAGWRNAVVRRVAVHDRLRRSRILESRARAGHVAVFHRGSRALILVGAAGTEPARRQRAGRIDDREPFAHDRLSSARDARPRGGYGRQNRATRFVATLRSTASMRSGDGAPDNSSLLRA